MKKVNLIAIIVCAVVVFIIGVFLLTSGKGSANIDLLSCNTKATVTEFIESNRVDNYTLDEQHCAFENLDVFGKESIVEVLFDTDAVSRIYVSWDLYDPGMERILNEEISGERLDTEYPHEYTQAERENVYSMFNSLKQKFEERVDIELEQYDLVPSYDGASLEDNDENFFQGSHIREYSVRDSAGILWLLRFEVCGGIAQVCLFKLVDETGYEGFIPVVDLTKA